MCGALLNHYKSTGCSQYSQDCHVHNIAHTLVFVVMETAASLGVKPHPFSRTVATIAQYGKYVCPLTSIHTVLLIAVYIVCKDYVCENR